MPLYMLLNTRNRWSSANWNEILLDECIPRKLKKELASEDCRSVPDEGWAGKKNGELLTLAESWVPGDDHNRSRHRISTKS